MLETLTQAAYRWYLVLSQLQAATADPLQALAQQWNIPTVSAFLFGVLGSLAPCQMTGNAVAIAYLTDRSQEGRRAVWREAAGYLWGKIAVYIVLGAAAIALGLQLPIWAMAALRRAFGPLMILFALYLLGLVRLRFVAGARLQAALTDRLPGRGSAGAFGLGAAYSLAFCPTMAMLFFGLLVPLGTAAPAGLLLPAFFAVGTALPLLAFAGFYSLSAGSTGAWLRGIRGANRYLRWLAGAIILLAGLNDTLLYWLF